MRTDSVVVPTVSELQQLLKSIEPAEYQRLARGFLSYHDAPQTTSVSLVDQIIMGLWEWFSHLGILTDAQRRTLLKKMGPVLASYTADLETCFEPNGDIQARALPVLVVTISDHRYAHWSHGYKLFDLQDEIDVDDELDRPPVTLIVCDVSALYSRLYPRIQQQRARHDPGHGRPTGKAGDAPSPGRRPRSRG